MFLLFFSLFFIETNMNSKKMIVNEKNVFYKRNKITLDLRLQRDQPICYEGFVYNVQNLLAFAYFLLQL